MTFNQKSPCQRHLKHDSTFNTTCNADPRLQCGVLKKPKYLYSYTIKNFIKIKHSWKRISEQARIRGKKEFALGTSSYHPPSHPRSSPSGFSGAFSELFSSPTTQTVGLRRGRYSGREEWGKGQDTPETKANLIRRKQYRISRPH